MMPKIGLNSKILRYKILILLLLLWFLSFNFIPIVNVKAQTYTDIDVDTAYNMINNNTQYPNLIVLDVRDQEEYNQGHLCSAILIPLGQLDSKINELDPYKNMEIIVYCRTGGRSAQGSQILVDHNFTKVYNMLGGITAWTTAGYETCLDENVYIIDFSFEIIIVILISTVSVLLIAHKKRLIRK
ncbi:MAG: rhodanese-like domain-containing protein [Promethearchaeota archaeon]